MPSNTDNVLLNGAVLVVTTSRRPSPFRSLVANPNGWGPTTKSVFAANWPAPFPSKTETVSGELVRGDHIWVRVAVDVTDRHSKGSVTRRELCRRSEVARPVIEDDGYGVRSGIRRYQIRMGVAVHVRDGDAIRLVRERIADRHGDRNPEAAYAIAGKYVDITFHAAGDGQIRIAVTIHITHREPNPAGSHPNTQPPLRDPLCRLRAAPTRRGLPEVATATSSVPLWSRSLNAKAHALALG